MNPNPQVLQEILAQFAPLFGLRGYREDVFRINPHTSFMASATTAVLHTDVWSGGQWRSFEKSTALELRAKVTPAPAREGARALHALNPGAWVHTDDTISAILDTRSPTHEPPLGKHWWRTHELLHELGVV